ncbi:hypothetical protein K150096H7_38250 [[Clostridium] symbiosum]
MKFAFVQIARSRTNAKFVTSVIPAPETMRKVNVHLVGMNLIIEKFKQFPNWKQLKILEV